MNSRTKLLLGQGIFTIIVIVSLGLIIMSEKGSNLLKNKADKEIDNYLETNYQELLSNLNKEELVTKNSIYTKKIVSKQNNHYYFYIKYNNKELTDTYKKDFEEGESLLNHIKKDLEEEIKKHTNISCTVEPTTTLNQYSNNVKEILIKEENLKEIKFYYIQKELTIENWNAESITKELQDLIQKMKENNITPKYYEITIINKNEITTSIVISNITEDFLEKDSINIIENILKNKKIENSKITYQYQN